MYDNSLFNFKNSINYLSIAGYKIIVGEDILTFRNGKNFSVVAYVDPGNGEITLNDTINVDDLRCILDVVNYCQNLIIFGRSDWRNTFLVDANSISNDIATINSEGISCIALKFAPDEESVGDIESYIYVYVHDNKYRIYLPEKLKYDDYELIDDYVVRNEDDLDTNLQTVTDIMKKSFKECVEVSREYLYRYYNGQFKWR